MAIIDELGIKVTVVVDDASLVEYEDPEPEETDDSQTMHSHKYVASQDKKEFSVDIVSTENLKWAKRKVNFGLGFQVFIDGREIDRLLAIPEDLENGSFNYRIEGLVEQNRDNGSTTLRKCRFSSIVLVDNADEATTTEDTQMGRDIGLIRVLVFRENPDGGFRILQKLLGWRREISKAWLFRISLCGFNIMNTILILAMERLEQKGFAIKAEAGQQAMTKRRLSDLNDMVDTPDESRERKRVFIDLTGEI
ncbi:hypothetical protein HJFPF1_08383 [Paramyrothecium foliicola]|nr:hypothetical protein HJFPF1_08383 [Paramyrothecium foliicola]